MVRFAGDDGNLNGMSYYAKADYSICPVKISRHISCDTLADYLELLTIRTSELIALRMVKWLEFSGDSW
jgi:hypothetical protein